MKVLGKALHTTHRGLVARANFAPKIGQNVLDFTNKRVGNVQDVFGPVASPYFVIKPASGIIKSDLEKLTGSDVYMGEGYGKGKRSEKVSRMRRRKARS